jgi:hypothetical protein
VQKLPFLRHGTTSFPAGCGRRALRRNIRRNRTRTSGGTWLHNHSQPSNTATGDDDLAAVHDETADDTRPDHDASANDDDETADDACPDYDASTNDGDETADDTRPDYDASANDDDEAADDACPDYDASANDDTATVYDNHARTQ